MGSRAKYFDGKTSAPQEVSVTAGSERIRISFDNSFETKQWVVAECKVDSFNSGKKLTIKYGDFPFESLEFRGDEAVAIAPYFINQSSTLERTYAKVLFANSKQLVIGGFLILFSVVFGYLKWFSPWVADQAVKIIPKEVEIVLGKDVLNRITAFSEIDSEKSKLLMEFYQVCGFESEYPINIHHVDEDLVNAFATPGGQIVVFQGIIDETKCWDELAGLLGHELAHVNQRHSFKIIARSLSSFLILSVLTGDVAGMSGIILENINQISQLANSREYEKEADIIGLQYLKRSKIRPEAMRDLFFRLLEASQFGGEIDDEIDKVSKQLEFFSSHPLSKNRIAYIDEIIASDSSYHYTAIDLERAIELWDQLKYGGDQIIEE